MQASLRSHVRIGNGWYPIFQTKVVYKGQGIAEEKTKGTKFLVCDKTTIVLLADVRAILE